MLAYDIIVWNRDEVVAYRKTKDDEWGLKFLKRAFEGDGYEVEIIERQEQIDVFRNSDNPRGRGLQAYLQIYLRGRGLDVLELPREYKTRGGRV